MPQILVATSEIEVFNSSRIGEASANIEYYQNNTRDLVTYRHILNSVSSNSKVLKGNNTSNGYSAISGVSEKYIKLTGLGSLACAYSYNKTKSQRFNVGSLFGASCIVNPKPMGITLSSKDIYEEYVTKIYHLKLMKSIAAQVLVLASTSGEYIETTEYRTLHVRPIIGRYNEDFIKIPDTDGGIISVKDLFGLKINIQKNAITGIVAFSEERTMRLKTNKGVEYIVTIIPTALERIL